MTTAAATRPKPASADWLSLDAQLCFAIYSTSLAMTKLYKPLLEPLGLTYPQYLVLLVLWERDELTVGDLGQQLFLDSGTLTPLLKRLQTSGIIVRERSAEDERRVIVRLTPAGRQLRQQAKSVPLQIGAATRCSADELVALTRQLQGLRSRLVPATEPAAATAAP